MLLGTVLLVGALSFMPAVVLGPIADHLSTACGRDGTAMPNPELDRSEFAIGPDNDDGIFRDDLALRPSFRTGLHPTSRP